MVGDASGRRTYKKPWMSQKAFEGSKISVPVSTSTRASISLIKTFAMAALQTAGVLQSATVVEATVARSVCRGCGGSLERGVTVPPCTA